MTQPSKFFTVYRRIMAVALPFIGAYLAYRKMRGKEDMQRFPERLGETGHPRPKGKLIWLHGASVGETLSMRPLIEKITQDYPKTFILVTSGTKTSAVLLGKSLPKRGALHQYVPIDRAPYVSSFLNHWKPDIVFWFESELWPEMLSQIHERKIPLFLINGRISDRSFSRWKRFDFIIRPMLSLFTRIFAKSEEDARRFETLGATDVTTVGNLKFSVPPPVISEKALEEFTLSKGKRPCFLASSTHEGEDGQIMELHAALKKEYPDFLTVILPRHPQRGEKIKEEAVKKGLSAALRSQAEPLLTQTDIYIADTMGETALFFRAIPLTFVGGSLIPFGGQNMIEPTRYGNTVFVGPHTENFREVMENARKNNAIIEISNGAELTLKVLEFVSRKLSMEEQAARAKAFAGSEEAVLSRLWEALTPPLSEALR